MTSTGCIWECGCLSPRMSTMMQSHEMYTSQMKIEGEVANSQEEEWEINGGQLYPWINFRLFKLGLSKNKSKTK